MIRDDAREKLPSEETKKIFKKLKDFYNIHYNIVLLIPYLNYN